jgi:hypothetical protein
MTKRVVLYLGAIALTVALFVVVSDRHVTDRVPLFEHVFVRFVVVLFAMYALGRLLRPLFRARTDARARG